MIPAYRQRAKNGPLRATPTPVSFQEPNRPRLTMKIARPILAACISLCLLPNLLAQDPVWILEVTSLNSTWVTAAVPIASGGAVAVRHPAFSPTPPTLEVMDAGGHIVQSITSSGTSWGLSFSGAPDGAGGAYLVGTEFMGGVGGPSLGGGDTVVFRFDGAGQLLWTRRFGGDGHDTGLGILEDGAGGFYLVGHTDSSNFGTASASPQDGYLARVDSAGTVSWVTRLNSGADTGVFTAIAHDGQGGLLVGGSFDDTSVFPMISHGFVAGFNTSGVQQWHHSIHPLGGRVEAVQPKSGGYVELAYDRNGGYMCTGRDNNGLPQWSVTLGPSGGPPPPFGSRTTPYDLVRRSNGTFLLGGYTVASGGLAHIRAFDENGSVFWDRAYPHSTGRTTSVNSMVLDGDGSVLVTGTLNATPGTGHISGYVSRIALENQGQVGCVGQPNSTGLAATTQAVGSLLRADNSLTLYTSDLPTHVFGYYLGSQASGYVPNPGGSDGDLCLGGALGRFNRTGEILNSDQEGLFHLYLDLDDLPSPSGSVPVLAGQTWYFQSWYREAAPLIDSNFSSSAVLTFQ